MSHEMIELILSQYIHGFSASHIASRLELTVNDVYSILSTKNPELKKMQFYRYLKKGRLVKFSDSEIKDIISDFNHGILVRNIAFNKSTSERTIREVLKH